MSETPEVPTGRGPAPDVLGAGSEGDLHESHVPEPDGGGVLAGGSEHDVRDDYTPPDPLPQALDTAPEPDVVEQAQVVPDDDADEYPEA